MENEIVEDEVVEEDAPEEEEESEEVEEEESTETSEDVEELKKRLAKAEKALVKNKREAKKQPITKPGSEKSDEIPEWGQKILATEEKRSFGHEHKLSPETVDAVFQFTGGKTPTETDMDHPAVKVIVKFMEASNRVAANTPRGGSAPTYKGKTYAETVASPDATKDDKQKAFEAAQKKHNIQ